MADYIATTEELTAVADAIRAKGGTSEQMVFPEGFVSAIDNIQTGGESMYHPVQNDNTTFAIVQVGFLRGAVAPYSRNGLPCADQNRNILTSFAWNTYTSWEIGVRIYPVTPSREVQVLFGCYYSGLYQYAPSMELYSDGRIGIGHTHKLDTWTTWYNTSEKWVDFDCWNFIRVKYADGTVTITLENDNGVTKKAEFQESAFPEVTNASYRRFAFGQIALNNNCAQYTYFDLDNTYILADGQVIFGRYAHNRDPNIGVTA